MRTIYNCHTHIFTNKIVPVNFLPFGLVRFLSKRRISSKLGKLLNGINPRSNDDIFDRYASFMNIGNLNSQLKIFKLLKGFYPEESKFVALSMDMEYMGAGEVPQDFVEQLNELSAIKKDYPNQLLPFICVHPRRPNITDLVKEYIEEHNFQGIKLYPPLGYYPFDERLYQIFEYAAVNEISIISHCSRGGVYYRGEITEDMLIHPKTKEKLTKKKNEHFTDYFTDPKNYEFLLEDFPTLKICLAHFGGRGEWKKYLATSWDKHKEKSWFSMIVDLIRKYPNVYTDISYTVHDTNLLPLLKVIMQDEEVRSKILYGSDFYVLELGAFERSFSINVRAYLGENNYKQIAEVNPQVFLKTTR